MPSVHTCKKSPFSVHTRPWFGRKKIQKRGQNRPAFTHAKNPRKSPSKKSPCLDSEKTEGFLHQRRTFFVRPKPFSVHTRPTRNRRNRLFLVHFNKLAFFFSPSKWDRFFLVHPWTLCLFFYRISLLNAGMHRVECRMVSLICYIHELTLRFRCLACA